MDEQFINGCKLAYSNLDLLCWSWRYEALEFFLEHFVAGASDASDSVQHLVSSSTNSKTQLILQFPYEEAILYGFGKNSSHIGEDLLQIVSGKKTKISTTISLKRLWKLYSFFFIPFFINAFGNWTFDKGLKSSTGFVSRIMKLENKITHHVNK